MRLSQKEKEGSALDILTVLRVKEGLWDGDLIGNRSLIGGRNERGRKVGEERPEGGALAAGSPAGKPPAWSGASRSKDNLCSLKQDRQRAAESQGFSRNQNS